jgi:hypothetical protein
MGQKFENFGDRHSTKFPRQHDSVLSIVTTMSDKVACANEILDSLEAISNEDDRLKDDIRLLRSMVQLAPGSENIAEDIVNESMAAETGGDKLDKRIHDLAAWWVKSLFLPSIPPARC